MQANGERTVGMRIVRLVLQSNQNLERTEIAKKESGMKTKNVQAGLETQAIEALKAVLGQVSVIKLKDVCCGSSCRDGGLEILVHAEVFGHSHTLACKVKTPRNTDQVRTALRNVHKTAADHGGNATPVLIAPYLSPEAQELCKEARAGFLDLEGNARIVLGEVFIGKRSLPCRNADRPAALPPHASTHLTNTGALRHGPIPGAEMAMIA
jgi:hypothetical protein